jgi:tetratricopeptide (TPR) repeat protein
LNSSHTTKRVSSFLNYKEGTFQVPDDIIAVLDLVDKSSFIAKGIEIVQLLFILGLTYTRTRDFDKSSKLLYKAHALVKAGDVTKGSLEEVVLMLDLAFLHIRLGFVQESMESTELADSNYKEAVQVFKSAASHPIFTSRHKRDDDLVSRNDDVASKITTLHKWQRKKLELILKHGLACALHRLGQSYARQRRADKAMKCFTDTANILNESHEVRASLSNWKSLSVFPIASRCFFQEIPAIYTAFILSDVYDRSGHISLESVSDQTSFHHFDLAIGIREFATTTIGTTLTVDSESLFECFDEFTWDTRDMNCFSAMLQLIDEIESDDADQNSGNAIWTKEDVLFRIGNVQMKAGQFREAVSSYREADKLTVKRLETRDHPIVMNINHNMGNALRAIVSSASTNDIDSAKSDAVACYSESMRISQVLFGKHHVTYADSLQSLAVLHTTKNLCLAITKDQDSDDNDDEIAYNSFRESLSIRKRELGSQNDLEIAFILQNLGDLCLRKLSIAEAYSFDDTETLKFVEDAISYLSESLEIRKLVLDQNHTSIGTTYQSLGIAHLYRAMACGDRMSSETNKAFTALTSALQIRKSLSTTLACRNSELSDEINDSVLMEAHCIFYLGRVEETRSNFSEAKAFYVDAMRLFQIEGQRRLAESERVDERISIELDAINLWVSRVLFHMANIEKVTDRVEESISCYEEALRIHSRCKCTKSNSLMNALINLALAKALHDEGDYDKSIYCFAKSLRTYLAHFGKNSVDVAGTLTGMGKSFSMMMNYDKAIQCYEKAMRIYEFSEVLAIKEKKGLLHRDIAIIKQQSEDGHWMEALEHYRSCVSFLEEFNERNKVVTGEDKSKQLMICYSEMLAILRKVIDIERDRTMKAELHDEIGDVLHRLGNLHATFAQYDEALECFAEVLKTQRVTNKDELRIADLLFNMGNIYLEQGKPDISCQCLSESYDITKLALGEDSKELHSTMYLMGVALTNISDYESALKFLSHALSVLRSKESNEDQSAFDKAARGKTLRQIGTVYESIGDHAKAISSLQESVQILKTVRGEDLELSNALNSLGNLLRNVSDFHQAMDCYDQSLAIRIELGDQVKIANTKNNIGAVLSALEELDRAMAFSAEALRIKTVHLGCNSVETGRALVNVSCP